MGTKYKGTVEETQALNTFIKLMRATDSISADLSRHVGQAELTLGQFGVLEALLHLGPMCQAELGAKLLRSGSNVTTVIDNLEKRGLVLRTRRATDRRMTDVSLTDDGRRVIGSLFPTHARRITQLFSALSPTQQEQLAGLCRTLGRGVAHTTPDTDSQ